MLCDNITICEQILRLYLFNSFLKMELIRNIYHIVFFYFLLFNTIMFEFRIYNYLTTGPEYWKDITGGQILVDIGTLYLPAFGMYLHFIFGFITMFLSFIQIIPWHEWFPSHLTIITHRIIGTIYCLSCIMASLGGHIYIFTQGTTGGRNMDLSFTIYGLIMIYYSLKTYISARQRDKKNHRENAHRLWSLVMAGIFYRLLNTVLIGLNFPVARGKFDHYLDYCVNFSFFLIPLLTMELYLNNYF